jgi:protein lifeguard
MKHADHADRMGFIKKVYSILFVQLAITAACVVPVVLSTKNNSYCIVNPITSYETCTITGPSLAYWMEKNWGWQIAAFFGAITTEITLICARHLARKAPINYIILLIFTICEAYMLSSTCIYYAATSPGTVMQAFIGTAMIVLACTGYAFTAKNDFTTKGAFVWILAMTLMFCGLFFLPLFWATGHVGFWYNVILVLCVFILGILLIHDTQLIVGKGRWRLGIDDYILGALILFVDIITILYYMLMLFGKK